MTPPRHQTQTERDLEGIEAKRKREAVPIEDLDDNYTDKFQTQQISREELVEGRRTKPDSKRIEKLEEKADAQALLADKLASNKWKRDLVDRIVTALIGLATGYLLGSR